MFENPTVEPNIIDVGQVVPDICHFLYFLLMTAPILDFGPYKCLKMCVLRFLFSSYRNKGKSITISLWASDSYGKYIPVYTIWLQSQYLYKLRLVVFSVNSWQPTEVTLDVIRGSLTTLVGCTEAFNVTL